MEEKELLKRIMQRPEVFAEAFNIFVFNGRDVIRPEGLQVISPAACRESGSEHSESTSGLLMKYQDPVTNQICFLRIKGS